MRGPDETPDLLLRGWGFDIMSKVSCLIVNTCLRVAATSSPAGHVTSAVVVVLSTTC